LRKRNNSCEIISIEKDHKKALVRAYELFFSGGIFIYPTDTIYGIGGNRFNTRATKRIKEIKWREEQKEFILLASSVENIRKYVRLKDKRIFNFLRRIFPNPISVILQLNKITVKELKSKTAAFRIPDNEFCRDLCEITSLPLISTSVNKRSSEPMNSIDKIVAEFAKEVDAIFYWDKEPQKKVSTLIDLTEGKPKLIREGAIKFQKIEGIYNSNEY